MQGDEQNVCKRKLGPTIPLVGHASDFDRCKWQEAGSGAGMQEASGGGLKLE
jgi:hypothetical protein